MKTKSFIGSVAIVLLGGSLAVLGQAAGGTSATAGASSGTATRTPEETSDIGKNANMNMGLDQGRTGDYLTGTVQVEGNPLLWEPVPVTVYCDGKVRTQVYADAKGHFQFKSTRLDSPSPQNPEKINLTAQYVGCTVRATLAGYQSSSLVISNRNLLDNPDIGTVKLSHDEHATGTSLSSTSATAPKNAVKAFEKAREDAMGGKNDKARSDLQKAVQDYPQFAAAWYQLGRLDRQMNDASGAQEAFSKSAAADPQYLPPYEQLAEMAALSGKWQEVTQDTRHALQLDPEGSPQIWYYDALGKFNSNDRKGAEASAEKSLAMDPNHLAPNTEQLLAVIEAGRGDYSDALNHLKHCLTYLPAGPNADLVKQQIAQLETRAPSGAQ